MFVQIARPGSIAFYLALVIVRCVLLTHTLLLGPQGKSRLYFSVTNATCYDVYYDANFFILMSRTPLFLFYYDVTNLFTMTSPTFLL